jgi:hypothetical protein
MILTLNSIYGSNVEIMLIGFIPVTTVIMHASSFVQGYGVRLLKEQGMCVASIEASGVPLQILYKGVNARRVPIRVIESPIAGGWPSTLQINDR